jgi:hypothetical protein
MVRAVMMTEPLMQAQTKQKQHNSSAIEYDPGDPHMSPPLGHHYRRSY